MTKDGPVERRIDQLTRWPLYAQSASAPAVLLLINGYAGGVTDRQWAALLALSVAQAVACVVLLRAAIDRRLGGGRPVRLPLAAAAALTLAGLLLCVGLADDLHPLTFGLAAGGSALVFCAALTCAVSPLLTSTRLALGVGVPAATLAAGQLALQGTVGWGVGYALCVGAAALTYALSLWVLDVMWELHRSRDVQARLAVAEERLRFARDLHDVLGRNLALVAIDSELAQRLVERGQDGSELLARIRQTAQDSMAELHDVVGAYRSADLSTELAGARSVLQAAGIETRVVGDGGGLPQDAQTTLGWVVREATTNILRHSDATAVTFDLAVDVSDTVLTIGNDGARAAGSGGTGLVGLRERLAARGGDVVVSTEPGTFVLVARLPVAS
ncbi:sensor histidine kinase [Cellulomonas sp. URHB0016]